MKTLVPTLSAAGRPGRQHGFTLVEMMVAVSIGLVVALGFTVSFVNLKATWATQDKLAQLQDNERLAMTYLTSTIEEAGYFIDSTPPGKTKATAFTSTFSDATYGNVAAGQFIAGTVSSGSVPVSVSSVYQSASGDGVLTCQGATNASGGTVTIRNTFYVDTTAHTLNCIVTTSPNTTALNATSAALVSNVDSMSLQYAVDTDADGSADTYMTADAVTDWTAVKAVRVTVAFINPNAGLGTNTATIPWTQTINLMNNR
jgi:type IV pilus assembly protein PilW